MTMNLQPFIQFPRSLAADLRRGAITTFELWLYCWIRLNTDPYGKAVLSLPSIQADAFPRHSLNYLTKVLLSLKEKRFIYYEGRRGKRSGSFEIDVGEIRLPHSGMKDFERLFREPVVSQNSTPISHNSLATHEPINTDISWPELTSAFITDKTQNEIETNKENHTHLQAAKISEETGLEVGKVNALIQEHGYRKIAVAWGQHQANRTKPFLDHLSGVLKLPPPARET